MERTNRNYAFVVPLVRALAELGLRHVWIAPGSRNTPLSLSFAAHDRVSDWSHHDERSAAFFALGMAKATGVPAAVVSTSGTAAAELFPAVVEARYGRVPLLVLTADRPAQLRDVGAPQTIDQQKLYGDAVKWSHDVSIPPPTAEMVRYVAALAGRAWAAALDDPPGPVHINLRFEEPLVPDLVPGEVPAGLPAVQPPSFVPGRVQAAEDQIARVASVLSARRTLIVCGPQDDPAVPPAITQLAAAGRFPVIADPFSQVRTGTHDLSHVIGTGDPLVRAGLLDRHSPEAVVRIGAIPTSKPITQWLAAHREVLQVLIDTAEWRDPGASAAVVLRADPAEAAASLAKALGVGAPPSWIESWRAADAAAGTALRRALERTPFPSEPGVVGVLTASLPAGAKLWVGSSMPVRDVDAFFPAVDRPIRFLANRGASGIDGLISSGLGAALADPAPTYLLAGDLSALHDLTALGAAARYQIPATVVVVNNDGGGIFHFLPHARFPEYFERHFATPHGLDFVQAAETFGVPGTRADTTEELAAAVAAPPEGPTLVEVRTDRHDNVAVHDDAQRAVVEALESLAAGAQAGSV